MSVSGDMSCAYSLQPATTKACVSARGGGGTRLQSVTTEVGVKAATVAAKQGAGSRYRSLSILSWEPVQLGTAEGPTTQGQFP